MCWPCRDTTSLLFLSHISISSLSMRGPGNSGDLLHWDQPLHILLESLDLLKLVLKGQQTSTHMPTWQRVAGDISSSMGHFELQDGAAVAQSSLCLPSPSLFPYHEMCKQGFLLTKASKFETNILRCAERRGLLCLQAAFTAPFLQVATCHSEDDRTVK